MSKSPEVKQMFNQINAEFGRVDLLVNNAGVAVFEMPEDLTEEAFSERSWILIHDFNIKCSTLTAEYSQKLILF